MSNAAIMASQASINAANAAHAAADHEAMLQRCMGYMQAYVPAGASVDQMREYARCVYAVHGTGQPLSAEGAMGLKILIVLAIGGFVLGMVKDWGQSLGAGDRLMNGFLGTMVVPFLVVAVWAAIGGIVYVLTGEFRSFP